MQPKLSQTTGARITTLVAKEVQRKSLSIQASPNGGGRFNSNSILVHPDYQTPSDDFRCPDCGKRNTNAKARKRHYATHIPCAQISAKDTRCVCCLKPMKFASHFEKNHRNCVIRMAGQLSEDTRVEASRQKRRITNAITELLHTNMRQARDRGGDSPLPKERTDNTEVSAFNAAPQSDSGNGTGISGMHLRTIPPNKYK
ncbi:hypothetical protein F5Y08DRAFT_211499 [Xylaria arbuscula]|nr:hypothetical protein F5Y08DRAFT_211499 [Xylaria arbuscula]